MRARVEEDGGVSLELAQGGVTVRAHATDFRWEHRMPLDFGNGFTSGELTALSAVGHDAGALVLVPAARGDVEPLLPWKAQRLRCDALRPEGGGRDQRAAPPIEPLDIEVSARVGGPMSFRLRHGVSLTVDGRRVRARLYDGAVIQAFVSEIPPDRGFTGSLTDVCLCCSIAGPVPRDCADKLELWATNGTRAERVGWLEARTLFEVTQSDGNFVTVRPTDAAPVGLLPGWRWIVASDALERCSELPRPAAQ
ncbi:MAG: hypothetical protein JNM17_40960 [Archangium sp.]|nr:hypothetical protein [Archangium sp.]